MVLIKSVHQHWERLFPSYLMNNEMGANIKKINQVTHSSQKRFIFSLMLSSVSFAIGVSIFLFGISTEYLVTTTDRFGVIGTGFALMLAGCGGAYLTLK